MNQQQETPSEGVELGQFVEDMDLNLMIKRTRPSERTEQRPHTYMAWIPNTSLLEGEKVVASPVGFGDSMTDATNALAEGLSERTVRVTSFESDMDYHDVILPVVTNHEFGQDEGD